MGLFKHIKNPIAYFKKVTFNMWLKELKQESDTRGWDIISLSDLDESVGKCDKYLDRSDPLSWIDNIENNDLHNALTSLTEEEQALITYVFHERKTQKEISEIYNVTRQTISYKLHKTLNKIREFLVK